MLVCWELLNYAREVKVCGFRSLVVGWLVLLSSFELVLVCVDVLGAVEFS